MEGEIYYPGHTLEMEISNFIKVWISVVVSLCYCYFSAKFVPKGKARLFSIIPILALFLALPLMLHSASLCSTTGFVIAWLSNFKLLLLAFGKGPLSDPSLSLPHFIAIACFPIRTQQNPPPTAHANYHQVHNSKNPPPRNNQENTYAGTTKNERTSIRNYAIKGVIAALLIKHAPKYSDHMHPKVTLVLICIQIYFPLVIILATAAAAARTLFGIELEPPFVKPHLSTSVQNFWGRRWNLVASGSLRSTVYEPALCVSARLIGRKWAPLPAVMCTFVVSALMHEIVFYYMGRLRPTWEITWFFLLHGACVVVEIWIKKVVKGGWRLPRLIATPMTLGFVIGTGCWLFVPQLLRNKMFVRGNEEYALLRAFVKGVLGKQFIGS